MTVIETKVKRWGNSFGIVIPSEIVDKEGLKEEQKISIVVIKDGSRAMKETFGIGKDKLKKTAQQIKNEARRELYN